MDVNDLNSSSIDIFNKDVFSSSYARDLFNIWFGVVAMAALTVWSMVSNIINIIVFVKQGLKERVNLTLFCLSCSDFMGAFFVAALTPGFVGDVHILSSTVESSSYIIYMGWCRTSFVDLSTALTVFIAIERCSCVTRPLHFNSSFIAVHGQAIVVAIILFMVANYLPLLSTFEFSTFTNSDTNSSIVITIYSKINIAIQQYNDFVFGISLAAICQIVIFVCAILMYKGLKKSSKVRNVSSVNVGKNTFSGNGLSNKERRVVKMILVLASLYMVSALPQIVFCWARALIPELPQNTIGNLHMLLQAINYYTAATYGAFSIFIYFNFSSSYRAVLRQFLTTSSCTKMEEYTQRSSS